MRIVCLENADLLMDSELVRLIASGKFEYLQALINRYMPYIIKTANGYAGCGVDTEDLIADGVLAVFNAVKAFDEDKSKFSTFVSVCVKRAMLSQLKSASAGKRIPDKLISPLEENEVLGENSPEDIYISKESFENFKKDIFSSLSSLEYKVLCAYLEGNSYSQVAEMLDITPKAVDNSLRRIRNKIKK